MNDLPTRPRSHVLESLSEKNLYQRIPAEWVLNKFHADYGLDYNCEIAIGDQVIGASFSIQLKAKDKDEHSDYVLIKNLKRSTINRWLKRLEPIMIVGYIEALKESYWTWVNEDTFDLTQDNQTFQVKIPKENSLSNCDWSKIHEYVERIFSRRFHLYDFPEKAETEDEQDTWNLFFQHNFQEALPRIRKLVAKNEKDPLLWNAVATCEYQLYNYKKALIAINKALSLKDDNTIKLNKASILTEYGDEINNQEYLQSARNLFEQIMLSERESNVLYNYGNCLRIIKEFEKARDVYVESLEMNPNNAQAWKNLGSIHYELGNHDLEISCYDTALHIDPELWEALFSKGVTLLIVFGRAQDALNLLLKGVEADRDKNFEIAYPYVYFWIAEAYLSLNDVQKASEWNRKALNINPIDNRFILQEGRIRKLNNNS